MEKYRILVADSSESSRISICSLLNKRGYTTYQASDGASALRVARSVHPDIVLIDLNLWGMNAYSVGEIIEADKISAVLYLTANPDKTLYERLEKMMLFVYITKPIQQEQLYQMVEFAAVNSAKMKRLSSRIELLETTIENKKKIDLAKSLLIKNLNIGENQAYSIVRKRSMDDCVPMEDVAEMIINELKKS
jgi:AmiR/NasT family two-component response regulator